MKTAKKDNLLLRLDIKDHNILRLKSEILGLNKSEMIRKSALIYWQEGNFFKHINSLYENKEQQSLILDLLVSLYRSQGFTYYNFSDEEKIKHLGRLIRTNSPLIDGSHLNQNVVGVSLANYFHPHMFSVKYSNTRTRTPIQTFENDDSLRDCIKRWLDMGRTINHSGLRRILKNRDGSRCVVNFKPAIAKFIYDKYCPESGRVLDPCAGYSGRLIGCISTLKNIDYHGIDPDPRTAIGNMNCAAFFSSQYSSSGSLIYPFSFNFSLGCAEDVMPSLPDNSYDLIFTSPPYFDLEQYSKDPSQSYLRYPDYYLWLHNFLYPIIKESKRLLKPGGHLTINIKDYGKLKLVSDSKRYAESIGLKLLRIYEMRLANYEFHLKKGEKSWHSEPILVFSNK